MCAVCLLVEHIPNAASNEGKLTFIERFEASQTV
jgi:hypothetical protein